MRIAVFVEDAAHEAFLLEIIGRLLRQATCDAEVQVRNAQGGRGAVLGSLRRYVRDLASGLESFAEILVVAIDGNCQGAQTIKRSILEVTAREHFPGLVVSAVPDPHIELWYLIDGHAVFSAVGAAGAQPALPAQKCERSRYKTLLREAFRLAEIDPPAGGSEYGADVAAAIDIQRACGAAATFGEFVTDLRGALHQNAANMQL